MFNHNSIELTEPIQRKTIKGQRWYQVSEGIRYPSVTTVLSCVEKPGLNAWKQAMGKDKSSKEMTRCADRGTAVHEMIEKYLLNQPNPTESHEQSNINLFNKIKTRLKKIDNIRCQERSLYSHMLKLAGSVDCIAEYDGVLSVIDFKTSNGGKSEDMIEDYFLQCTAYAIMFAEMFDIFIEDIVIIIAPEKSNTMSMVYKKKINTYVAPLLKRIAKFKELNPNAY
jgi:hypothetical protein